MNFEDLFNFLKKESHADETGSWENYFLPLLERVTTHTCLAPVEVISITEDELQVRFEENFSRFREGDLLLVNDLATLSQDLLRGFQMEWHTCDFNSQIVTLKRAFDTRRERIPFQPGQRLMLDPMLDSIPLLTLEALTSLTKNETKKDYLSQFLEGRLEDQLAEPDSFALDQTLKAFRLTGHQKKALVHGITHYPVAAIQGPPGTGKTEILAALATYYLLRGYEVLVSAVSHYAINNALDRIATSLHKLKTDSHAIKVSKNKNSGLSRLVLKTPNLRQLDNNLSDKANAYGMTPFKFPYEIAPQRFRILLLDEASQAHLPFTCLAMAYARKTIFLGDHKQTGPILTSANHPPASKHSAFEHIAKLYPKLLFPLTETFRLSEELAALPSSLFYQDSLISKTSFTKEILETWAPLQDDPIFTLKHPAVLVEASHAYANKFSKEEATIVLNLIGNLLKSKAAKPEMIAVLVPFRSQQNLIRQQLSKLEITLGYSLKNLLVDTVERMQGQEREVILFSLTMSDPRRLSQIAEFFFNPGRFNVALTRARLKRIVIGSSKIFAARPKSPADLKQMNVFAEFWSKEYKVRWSEVAPKYPPLE